MEPAIEESDLGSCRVIAEMAWRGPCAQMAPHRSQQASGPFAIPAALLGGSNGSGGGGGMWAWRGGAARPHPPHIAPLPAATGYWDPSALGCIGARGARRWGMARRRPRAKGLKDRRGWWGMAQHWLLMLCGGSAGVFLRRCIGVHALTEKHVR